MRRFGNKIGNVSIGKSQLPLETKQKSKVCQDGEVEIFFSSDRVKAFYNRIIYKLRSVISTEEAEAFSTFLNRAAVTTVEINYQAAFQGDVHPRGPRDNCNLREAGCISVTSREKPGGRGWGRIQGGSERGWQPLKAWPNPKGEIRGGQRSRFATGKDPILSSSRDASSGKYLPFPVGLFTLAYRVDTDRASNCNRVSILAVVFTTVSPICPRT